MKNFLISILFITLSFLGYSQDKGNLSMDISTSVNFSNMERLNSYLIDTSFNMNSLYDSSPKETIKKGYSFRNLISYQPINFVDFGIYGSYEFGQIERNPVFEQTDPFTGDVIKSYPGVYKVKASSFGIGINSTFHINKLLKLHEKESFLKRLLIGVEVSGGAGFSMLSGFVAFEGLSEGNLFDHRATNFQFNTAIRIGLITSNKGFLSSLGLRIGYQYYKTSVVKKRSGDEIVSANGLVNLDFSGFFLGVFLKLGK